MSELVVTKQDEEKIRKKLERKEKMAKLLIASEQKLDELLIKLEKEFEEWPHGDILANIPIFVALLKSYIKGEYKNFPMNSLVSIVAFLLYWVSPVDIIPDKIPLLGKTDDLCALNLVLRGVGKDLDEYKAWRDGKEQALVIKAN